MSNERDAILLDTHSSRIEESSAASGEAGKTAVLDSTAQAEEVTMGTFVTPPADEDSVPGVSPPREEIAREPRKVGLVIEAFRPTDQTTLFRFMAMLFGGTVAGTATSLAVYLVSGWTGFYVPVVFGGLIGFAVSRGVKIGETGARVELKWVHWTVAVTAGCLSYLALQYLTGRLADPGVLVGSSIFEAAFWRWLVLEGDIESLFLWFLDAVVLVSVAGSFGAYTLGAPYCLECQKLCKSRPLFATSNELSGNVLNALGNRDYKALKRLEVEDPPVRDRLNVRIYYCENAAHDGYLTLTCVRPKGDGGKGEEELVRYAVVKNGGTVNLCRDFPQRK